MKTIKGTKNYKLGSKREPSKYTGLVVTHFEKTTYDHDDLLNSSFIDTFLSGNLKEAFSPDYHFEAEINYFFNFLRLSLQDDDMALFLLDQMLSRCAPNEAEIIKMRPYGHKTFALSKYLEKTDKNQHAVAARGLKYMILARHCYDHNDLDKVVIYLTKAAYISRLTMLMEYELAIHQGQIRTEGLAAGNPKYSDEQKKSYCQQIADYVSQGRSKENAYELVIQKAKKRDEQAPSKASLRSWYRELSKNS